MNENDQDSTERAPAPSIFDRLDVTKAAGLTDQLVETREDKSVEAEVLEEGEADGGDLSSPILIEIMPEMRDALVFLLKKGLVELDKNKSIYRVIKQHQSAMKSYLKVIYIQLVIDDQHGLIFTRSEERDTDAEEGSLVWRRQKQETYLNSLLYMIIRRRYQEREIAGETTIHIDLDHIQTELPKYWSESHSGTRDKNKILAGLKRAVEENILIKSKEADDRFQISPMIKHQMNMDYLQDTLKAYQAIGDQPVAEAPEEEAE